MQGIVVNTNTQRLLATQTRNRLKTSMQRPCVLPSMHTPPILRGLQRFWLKVVVLGVILWALWKQVPLLAKQFPSHLFVLLQLSVVHLPDVSQFLSVLCVLQVAAVARHTPGSCCYRRSRRGPAPFQPCDSLGYQHVVQSHDLRVWRRVLLDASETQSCRDRGRQPGHHRMFDKQELTGEFSVVNRWPNLKNRKCLGGWVEMSANCLTRSPSGCPAATYSLQQRVEIISSLFAVSSLLSTNCATCICHLSPVNDPFPPSGA